MYFCLELDGRRAVVQAKKNASIGQVTEQAFGPTIDDARVLIVSRLQYLAQAALNNKPFQLTEGA